MPAIGRPSPTAREGCPEEDANGSRVTKDALSKAASTLARIRCENDRKTVSIFGHHPQRVIFGSASEIRLKVSPFE
jgi:hypothetical protein